MVVGPASPALRPASVPCLFGSQCLSTHNEMTKPYQTYNLAEGDLHMAVLFDRVLERALRFRAFDSWATRDHSLDELVRLLNAEVLFESQQKDTEPVVLDLQQALLML